MNTTHRLANPPPQSSLLSDAALRLYCTAWARATGGQIIWTLEEMSAATGIPLGRLPQVRHELGNASLWASLGENHYRLAPITALRARLVPPTRRLSALKKAAPTRWTTPTPLIPRIVGMNGRPAPISKEEAWTLFAQASAIVGTRAMPQSHYARTAMMRLYTRLREGYTTKDILTATRAAAARTAGGDTWTKWRSLIYCWSSGFVELLAAGTGSPSAFRQGPALDAWAHESAEFSAHIPDPLTGK